MDRTGHQQNAYTWSVLNNFLQIIPIHKVYQVDLRINYRS